MRSGLIIVTLIPLAWAIGPGGGGPPALGGLAGRGVGAAGGIRPPPTGDLGPIPGAGGLDTPFGQLKEDKPNPILAFCDVVSALPAPDCAKDLFGTGAAGAVSSDAIFGSAARHSWSVQRASEKCAKRFDQRSAEVQAIMAVTGAKPEDMIPYAAAAYQIVHTEQPDLSWSKKDAKGDRYRMVFTTEQRESAGARAEKNMEAAARMGVDLERVNRWVRTAAAFFNNVFAGAGLVREGVASEMSRSTGDDRVNEAKDRAYKSGYNDPWRQGEVASCRAREGDSYCTDSKGDQHVLGPLDSAPIEIKSSTPDNSGILPGEAIARPDPLSLEQKTALQKCIETETRSVLDDIGSMVTVEERQGPETEAEKKAQAERLLRWGACDNRYYGKEECDMWRRDLHVTGMDKVELEEQKRQRDELLQQFPTACNLATTPEDTLFCEGIRQELNKRYAFNPLDDGMIQAVFSPGKAVGVPPTKTFNDVLLDGVKQIAVDTKRGGSGSGAGPNTGGLKPPKRPVFAPNYTPKPRKAGTLPPNTPIGGASTSILDAIKASLESGNGASEGFDPSDFEHLDNDLPEELKVLIGKPSRPGWDPLLHHQKWLKWMASRPGWTDAGKKLEAWLAAHPQSAEDLNGGGAGHDEL